METLSPRDVWVRGCTAFPHIAARQPDLVSGDGKKVVLCGWPTKPWRGEVQYFEYPPQKEREAPPETDPLANILKNAYERLKDHPDCWKLMAAAIRTGMRGS